MGEERRLDELARDLANGSISRRTALRRLAAGAFGLGLAAAPSALADELERGRCPKERRCDGKCCPKNAKCKNGKCKCKSGFTKCGKKCVDLQSSATHCGACGNTCDDGRACVNGQCEQCSTPGDCPDPGNECLVVLCDQGTCGTAPAAEGTFCTANGGQVCDSNGTCVECNEPFDCPGVDDECQTRTCNAGTCGVTFAAAGTPVANQTSGDCQTMVCNGSGGTTQQVDDSDVPAGGGPCVTATCVNGTPMFTNAPPGTACNENGGLCNGAGQCV